jgi:hypothetical protein
MSEENSILGGGGLGYVIQGGHVYIKADDLAGLLGQTGASMGIQSITTGDKLSGAVAHALLLVSEKTDALSSYILKEEAEASLRAMFDEIPVVDLGLDDQQPETD